MDSDKLINRVRELYKIVTNDKVSTTVRVHATLELNELCRTVNYFGWYVETSDTGNTTIKLKEHKIIVRV